MTKKNNKYNRRNKSNKHITKLKIKTNTGTKKYKKDKKILEFNKYINSDRSYGFNYIKMPYMDTTMVHSRNILLPIDYSKTDKDRLNTELIINNHLNDIKK